MSRKYVVGTVLPSNQYGDFKIIHIYSSQRYRVKFLLTGYEKDISLSCIIAGEIRDPYFPIYYNVACFGDVDIKENQKAVNVWRFMIERCYNVKHDGYHLYGGKGVTVSERWLCCENFIKDLPKIKGYDETLFNNGELHLDKDIENYINGKENKEYSLSNCQFVSIKINHQEMLARLKQTTSSRYVGVTKLKSGKWQVTVVYNGRSFYGGRYINEKEASKAYQKLKEDIYNNPEKYLSKEKKKFEQKYIAVYKNNELILIHKGLSDLCNSSLSLLNIKLEKSNVSAVCLGKYKYYKGFEFKYVSKEDYDKYIEETN